MNQPRLTRPYYKQPTKTAAHKTNPTTIDTVAYWPYLYIYNYIYIAFFCVVSKITYIFLEEEKQQKIQPYEIIVGT